MSKSRSKTVRSLTGRSKPVASAEASAVRGGRKLPGIAKPATVTLKRG